MTIRGLLTTAGALCALLAASSLRAQEVYTRTDVREAVARIERHGDEFKKAFKSALEHVKLTEQEKRIRDLANDLEDEVDHLKDHFKDGDQAEFRSKMDNAMLMAASIDRFMQRNYFDSEARRAWENLRSDLNVIAVAYHMPLLPVLTPSGSEMSAKVGPVGGHRTQMRLDREVRHELVMLPFYGVFDHLTFRTEGDTVILAGEVTRPTTRESAEKVVREIEGVHRVINEIQVLPLSPDDDRIRQQLYHAVYGQPALNRYALQAVPSIHLVVRNGHVSLEGVVANENDRNIANIQAQSVPGVLGVTNNLRVE